MIVRIWEGRVPASKAEAYLKLMREVAIPDYSAVAGNRGAWCIHRQQGEVVHVRMVSRWDSLEVIKGFAGEDVLRAKYYDFDTDYLLEFAECVEHWDLLDAG